MRDRYFFDKRDWKRRLIKYGIIFLISFVPIVLFNVYCSDYIGKEWLVVFLDCVFLLIFVVFGNMIATKIFEKKDRKLERLRKEREEIEARKKQIMEDSYKRKREEKQKKKEVVLVEDTEETEIVDKTTTKKTSKKNTRRK